MEYRRYGEAFYVRLDKGDEVISSILDVCRAERLRDAGQLEVRARDLEDAHVVPTPTIKWELLAAVERHGDETSVADVRLRIGDGRNDDLRNVVELPLQRIGIFGDEGS